MYMLYGVWEKDLSCVEITFHGRSQSNVGNHYVYMHSMQGDADYADYLV